MRVPGATPRLTAAVMAMVLQEPGAAPQRHPVRAGLPKRASGKKSRGDRGGLGVAGTFSYLARLASTTDSQRLCYRKAWSTTGESLAPSRLFS